MTVSWPGRRHAIRYGLFMLALTSVVGVLYVLRPVSLGPNFELLKLSSSDAYLTFKGDMIMLGRINLIGGNDRYVCGSTFAKQSPAQPYDAEKPGFFIVDRAGREVYIGLDLEEYTNRCKELHMVPPRLRKATVWQ